MLCSCLGDANMNKTQLIIGLIQLMTSVYLLGWIISIYWGYLIVKKSKGDHNEIKQLMNAAGGAQDNEAAGSTGSGLQASASGGVQRKKANNPYED